MVSKKAAFSLSLSVIIILIIAITVLGLGLGFVRMLFGGATEKFEGLLAEEAEPEIPTASNPVRLSKGVVITNPGKDKAIKISLYNPTNGDWEIKPSINCSPTDFSTTTHTKKIAQGKYVTFGALIKIPGTEQKGTHLCKVTFDEATAGTLDYSADFTIQIQYG